MAQDIIDAIGDYLYTMAINAFDSTHEQAGRMSYLLNWLLQQEPVSLTRRASIPDASLTGLAFSFICKGISLSSASSPVVVNERMDVICSTSVSLIWLYRAMEIDTLIRQLAEISLMTKVLGKTAWTLGMKQDFRCSCWLMEKPGNSNESHYPES